MLRSDADFAKRQLQNTLLHSESKFLTSGTIDSTRQSYGAAKAGGRRERSRIPFYCRPTV